MISTRTAASEQSAGTAEEPTIVLVTSGGAAHICNPEGDCNPNCSPAGSCKPEGICGPSKPD